MGALVLWGLVKRLDLAGRAAGAPNTLPSEVVAYSVYGSGDIDAPLLGDSGWAIAKPRGVLPGDLLITHLVAGNNANPVAPSGWTALRSDNIVLGRRISQFSLVYYKIATDQEPDVYEWRSTGNRPYSVAQTIVGLRGVDLGPHGGATVIGTFDPKRGQSRNAVCPSLALAGDGVLLCFATQVLDGSRQGSTWIWPKGMIEIADTMGADRTETAAVRAVGAGTTTNVTARASDRHGWTSGTSVAVYVR